MRTVYGIVGETKVCSKLMSNVTFHEKKKKKQPKGSF